MTQRSRFVFFAAIFLAGGLVWVPPATAQAAAISVTTAAVTVNPLPSTPSTGTNVSAPCPGGTNLVGGGGFVYKAADPATVPSTTFWVKSMDPSDPSGTPFTDGSTDPSVWTTVSAFGPMSETNDAATSFAMCDTNGPTATVVETAVSSPAYVTQGNPPAKAIATCPVGTQLVGGGILDTPNSSFNFLPKASYPSDSSGNAPANGSLDPNSWTAYAGVGSPTGSEVNGAFAVCATAALPAVEVAVVDAPAPTTAGTFTNTTVACPSGTTLLDGGFAIDETVGTTSGLEPNQGIHSRGSFPSDGSGNAVANGTVNAGFWTAVVQPGGQSTPNHFVHVFALCAQTAPANTIPEAKWPVLLVLSGLAVGGATIIIIKRRGQTTTPRVAA